VFQLSDAHFAFVNFKSIGATLAWFYGVGVGFALAHIINRWRTK